MTEPLPQRPSRLEWRILGPVEVCGKEGPVSVGGSRERLVLSRLLLSANRVVAQDTLIDDLWEGSPPEGAAQALWVYVSRLRKALRTAGADGVLETSPPGYRLRVGEGELDMDQFESLVAEGRGQMTAGAPKEAADRFRDALALWRGPALVDVASLEFARSEAARLEESRLAVLEARVECDLACGRHRELIGELAFLTREHPLRERLWAHRMLALYRAGRQAEALRAYQDLRRYLGDELGIEPSEELRALEGAILRQEPGLVAAPGAAEGMPRADVGPTSEATEASAAQLPLPRAVDRAETSAFVGRQAELERLHQAWTAVLAGERRLVLVAGEPGIGKSRLSAEAARAAHASGGTVLFGRCDEGMGAPYQPFVEALTGYLAQASSPVLGPSAGELARLAPGIRERMAEVPEPLGLDPEMDRYRLFQAVTGWLTALSDAVPLVLVLDDLHWATAPTLAMLRHLIRSAELSRLLIVGTYRDTELDITPALSDEIAELLRHPGVERLRLSGLDEAGVAAFMEATARQALDESGLAFVPMLQRETGGNPFFVGQVMRHLTESGFVHRESGRWVATAVPLPDDLADVINRRLARLPEETKSVLAQAAVLGETFDLAVLVRATDEAEISVLRAIDPAAAARLLAEASERRPGYRFVHALVRAAVYDALPRSRRLELHGHAARAIEQAHAGQLDDHLTALAHHYARAGSADQDRAIEFTIRAGERAAALLAHGEAVRLYRQALDLLDASGATDPRRRCDLLIGLGAAQRMAVDDNFAIPLAEAVGIADALGDAERLGRAALAHSRGTFIEIGTLKVDRIALFRRALAALGPDDSVLRARLLGALAGELFWAADPTLYDTSIGALKLAERLGDPTVMAQVLATVFPSLLVGGSPTFVETWDAKRLWDLTAEVKDPFVHFMVRLGSHLVSHAVGDPEASAALTQDCIRLAESAQHPFIRWLAEMLPIDQLLSQGRFAEGEAVARTVWERGVAAGLRDADTVFKGQLFWIRYEQGRLDEMIELLRRGGGREGALPFSRALLYLAQCELGEPDEARTGFQKLIDNLAGPAAVPLPAWCLLAEVAVALGDRARAQLLEEWLAPHAAYIPVMGAYTIGPTAHYLGRLAALRDDAETAAERFEAALAIGERMQAPTWVARSRVGWAELLARTGRPGDADRARDLAALALTTATELGLGPIAGRARAVLES